MERIFWSQCDRSLLELPDLPAASGSEQGTDPTLRWWGTDYAPRPAVCVSTFNLHSSLGLITVASPILQTEELGLREGQRLIPNHTALKEVKVCVLRH